MALLVKICGLSTEATVDAAVDAGADMVGFVFFPRSPRHISVARARELRRRVGDRAAVVALTVDPTDADLDDIMAIRPDWVQLHGRETPARVLALRARLDAKIMKAIGVRTAEDVAAGTAYAGAVDRMLFDAKPPLGAMPGGNGIPFDWRLLQNWDAGVPFMLSGGLDAGSLPEAVAIARPDGVDVSSGVETAPGRKDADLIRAFVAAARLAEVRARVRSGSVTMSASP